MNTLATTVLSTQIYDLQAACHAECLQSCLSGQAEGANER